MQTAIAAAPAASHKATSVASPWRHGMQAALKRTVDSPSVVIASIFGLFALCQESDLDWATSLRALREVVTTAPGQRSKDVALRILDAVLRHSRMRLTA